MRPEWYARQHTGLSRIVRAVVCAEFMRVWADREERVYAQREPAEWCAYVAIPCEFLPRHRQRANTVRLRIVSRRDTYALDTPFPLEMLGTFPLVRERRTRL